MGSRSSCIESLAHGSACGLSLVRAAGRKREGERERDRERERGASPWSDISDTHGREKGGNVQKQNSTARRTRYDSKP